MFNYINKILLSFLLLFLSICTLAKAQNTSGRSKRGQGYEEFYEEIRKRKGQVDAPTLQRLRQETVLKRELQDKKNISQEVEAWRERSRLEEDKINQRKKPAKASQSKKGQLPPAKVESVTEFNETTSESQRRSGDRGAIKELRTVPNELKFERPAPVEQKRNALKRKPSPVEAENEYRFNSSPNKNGTKGP